MNLNKFYQDYRANPLQTKTRLTLKAITSLCSAVQEGLYNFEDLAHLNYSQVTGWLDWPDFKDGGIFEQIIDNAADTVLVMMDYKPQHYVDIP